MSAGGAFLLFLVFTVLWLLVASFVYSDAKARGHDTPGALAVLVFLAGLLGLVVYLLVRKPRGGGRQRNHRHRR